jgi:hypothetical protein
MKDGWEDRSLSLLAIVAAAGFAWNVAATSPGSPAYRALDGSESRVLLIAQAIATAEGFYAPGEHDGRSLPSRLNNPGALKKPALGAAALPTWKDTGLVHFPTVAMGWAALHAQIRRMFAGRSRLYHPSDTLWLVGTKYADGDVNWGNNVATLLGVSPETTLAQLAAHLRRDPVPADSQRGVASDARRVTDTDPVD